MASPRTRARVRIIRLARALLPMTDGVTEQFVRELCAEADVTPAAFRILFPTNGHLQRGVNQHLIEECVERLQAIPEAERGKPIDVGTAALRLASAWPIDWAGQTIRAKERAAALTNPLLAPTFLAAERGYAPAILEVFLELLPRMGRQFSWPPLLAVRVVLLTYERSFESWLMRGESERAFPESPYVRETLPRLLDEITEPMAGRMGDSVMPGGPTPPPRWA